MEPATTHLSQYHSHRTLTTWMTSWELQWQLQWRPVNVTASETIGNVTVCSTAFCGLANKTSIRRPIGRLWGDSRWIASRRPSNAELLSLSWRHHKANLRRRLCIRFILATVHSSHYPISVRVMAAIGVSNRYDLHIRLHVTLVEIATVFVYWYITRRIFSDCFFNMRGEQ